MKIKVLREKTDAELKVELTNLLKDQQNMKFKKVIGVIDNPLKIRSNRREIAQIKTILHEREIERILKELGKKA